MALNQFGTGVAAAALALSANNALADEPATGLEHLAPAVVEQIAENYRACIEENILASDWNGDGKISNTGSPDGYEEADALADLNDSCDENVEQDITLAELKQRIAVAKQEGAEADIAIAAITTKLMEELRVKFNQENN